MRVIGTTGVTAYAASRVVAPALAPFAQTLAHHGVDVLSQLGAGRQGTAYLAKHPIGTIVVKEAHAATVLREVEALKRIGDSGGRTPTLLFHEVIGGHGLFGMTKGEGAALTEAQKNALRARPELAVDVILNLLRSLRATHAGGIVHADLGPSNFLVSSAQKVMLIDFGLAQSIGKRLHFQKPPKVSISAPEVKSIYGQALPAVAHPTQDLFSAAVHLVDLLADHAPYSVPIAHREDPAPWRRAYSAGPKLENIEAGLQTVLRKALSIEPEKRFQSAQAFIDALRPFSASRLDSKAA
jgi:serine/threonine-protein kinase